jgi:hypothetical protein
MVELYLHSPICLHSIVLNNIIKYRVKFTVFTLYLRTSVMLCLGPYITFLFIYRVICLCSQENLEKNERSDDEVIRLVLQFEFQFPFENVIKKIHFLMGLLKREMKDRALSL